MRVYDYCVICEEKLTENEKKFNKEYENIDFPICHFCLSESVNEIQKIIGKDKGK